MDTFLPDGYEPPKTSSRYTKFEEWKQIRLRILTFPILGWEFWNKTNPKEPKPVRYKYNVDNYKLAKQEAMNNPKLDDQRVNHFWAMVVWNYDTKQIEVCEIVQKTIQSAIRNYIEDKDYGNPLNYDIKIFKKKENDKVTYETTPWLPKEITDEVREEYLTNPVNLIALFYNADPFDTTWTIPPIDDWIPF